MIETWGEFSNHLIESAKEKRIPIAGTFELTPRCNLSCKMCYIRRPVNDQEALSRELTAKEWISVAKQARDAGMLYLLLSGGEIFLRPDFRMICEEIANMGLITTLYTNATLVTSDIAKWLKTIPLLQVEVSMYGASRETYARTCGNADGFNLTVQGIDFLLSEDISLQLRTTPVKSNFSDFLPIAAFAEKRGIKLGIVTYISPRREGSYSLPEEERMSPLNLVQHENKLSNYYRSKRELEETKPLDYTCLDDSASKNQDAFQCIAGKCSFWITWDGGMTPCGLMNSPMTFPLESGFPKSWVNLMDLCSKIPPCPQCQTCELKDYCEACPARLKNETGFFNKPSTYLCQSAKLRKKYDKQDREE